MLAITLTLGPLCVSLENIIQPNVCKLKVVAHIFQVTHIIFCNVIHTQYLSKFQIDLLEKSLFLTPMFFATLTRYKTVDKIMHVTWKVHVINLILLQLCMYLFRKITRVI